MPTILQLRRGSTAENDAYTGSVGEITVDTTLSTVRLHDGSTAGGSLVGNLQKNIQLGITGDNEIDTSSGNLTIDSAGGTVTIDDNLNISGTTTVSGHILPDADVTYDLGSSSFKFRDIYLSGTSINLGDATITASGSSIVLPSGSAISGGSGDVVDLNSSQTLTNKTLTSPVISTISNSGTVTIPTGTVTLASTGYVDTAVANVIDSAPGALDTLNELAAALGDDANYASTTTTALSNRLRIDTNAQGLTSTQKSNAITNLGLSTVATSGSYTDLSNTSSVVTLSGSQTLTNKTLDDATLTGTLTAGGGVGTAGQVLKSTGTGVEWGTAAAADTNTTYTVSAVDSGDDAIIRLTGSDASTDDVTLAAGSNITITPSGDTITIASTASGSALTIQDEGSTLSTAATTLNFVGSGVTASGTGSTKTITISGGGGGSADLSAVSEDILPSFDEVYDIGSSTYKWYDGFFTNSINLDTIALTNSSGTLSINSDVTVGSLLVDSLLLSENTITADASTALQYLGDKGVVEINSSNLDVREGDWIGVPVVETTTTNTITVNVSDGDAFSQISANTVKYYDGTTDFGGPVEGNYHYFNFQNSNGANNFLALLNQTDIGSFTAVDSNGDDTTVFTFNGTDVDAQIYIHSSGRTVQWKKSSGTFTSLEPSDDSNIANSALIAEFTSTINTTTSSSTTTPPLTTGAEGIIRYNKDEGRFEGYNAEGWASLGGLETNEAGDNIITGNLVVSGDITSTSDKTLKDNIKSIEGALDIVTKLSGKMFTMKSDETQKEKIGFIAQEIEQHLPQVVSTDSNGIKSVSYGNVAALLVEAIKELNQKIEDLTK